MIIMSDNVYHNTPIYAVDRQPLFCTFCARAQNVSKQSCHLGPSGQNGKIRGKFFVSLLYSNPKVTPKCTHTGTNTDTHTGKWGVVFGFYFWQGGGGGGGGGVFSPVAPASAIIQS